MGDKAGKYSYIIFIIMVIFIITAVSNGANMTDGLDGLATGTSAIIGTTLGILAYLSGNIVYSDYLNIMYLPNTGELVVFMSAFIGALVGFLWYNSYPAQVFMGDTGSLALGGIIAVFAIIIRKELLIPILCGIFLVESLSVVMQVSYFRYTKRKFGEGRRIFRMAPIHHHYQVLGFPESKIVTRFWIIGIMLAVLTIVTLKIQVIIKNDIKSIAMSKLNGDHKKNKNSQMKKRIVILGAGESGTGAAILARKHDYEVFVSDISDIKPRYKEMLLELSDTFRRRYSYRATDPECR